MGGGPTPSGGERSAQQAGLLQRMLRGDGLFLGFWARYGWATALVALALTIRVAVLPAAGAFVSLTFYPAVILSALWLGAGPALLAALLSAAAATYLFLRATHGAFSWADSVFVVALFVISCMLILLLAETVRRAKAELEIAEWKLRGLQGEQRALNGNRLIGIAKYKGKRIVWVNEAFAAMFGYERYELIDQSTGMLFANDLAHEEFRAQSEPVVAHGGVFRAELDQVRKDGTRGWFEVNCAQLAAGNSERIGVFVDVTEKRAILTELRASEARLKQAQSIAKIGSWEIIHGEDADAPVRRIWSEEMFRIYGIAPSAHGPTPEERMEAIHPDERTAATRAFRDPIEHRLPTDFRHRVLCKDGKVRYVHVLGETTYAADGRPERSAGTAQDVTELVLQEQALRQSEERLRRIFATMTEGLVLRAQDGRVIDANPAALDILGLSRDQVLGIAPVNPEWHAIREDHTPFPRNEQPEVLTLRTGRPLRGQTMGVRVPGRGLRWISVNSEPIFRDGAALPEAVITTFFDITELRGSYERIRRLAQRIETVRAEERRAVALSLHEGVAQQLFAVKLGVANLLARVAGRPDCAAAGKELLQAVDAGMDELRQVANDLHPVAIAHQSLAEILRRHAEEFGKLSGLAIDVAEVRPFPRLGEPTRLILFRAAQEALTNVAKHARAKSVQIVLRADAERIIVEVADDGVGVTDSALNKPGSLGLVGIRERLGAHHGGLAIHRRDPAGTVATMYIPLTRGAQQWRA